MVSKVKTLFGHKYDESFIPYGQYCYEPDFEKNNNKSDKDIRYYIKPCKYYKSISKNWNGCMYLNMITNDFVFDDKCKMCGINDDYKCE